MMGSVLNRTTKVLLRSVNTPDFSEVDWVINPDGVDELVASGIPPSDWKINPGGTVQEMTSGEKDASILSSEKSAKINAVRGALTVYMDGKYDAASQMTLNALWNEANHKGWGNRSVKVQAIMTWISSVLTSFYAKKNAVLAATTVAAVRAVSTDFSSFTASFPDTAVEEVFALKN
jgi:hypothetical protein